MKTVQLISMVTFLSGMLMIPTVYAKSQADAAQQQIKQAVASGNIQSVIAALPTLENMWPKSMGEYFQSAEEIARFLNDAGDDPAVKEAVESLYAEVLDKRFPEEAGFAQATVYFKGKQKAVGYYFGLENMRYNKPHLLAVSRFLGEIRDRRIPDYQNGGRPMPGREILEKAGVSDVSSLSDPALIQAYEKAIDDNQQEIEMNRLQQALFYADSYISSKLLYSCKQLRHDGKLDDDFADEVAENGHLTEKEREMKDPFMAGDSEWGI